VQPLLMYSIKVHSHGVMAAFITHLPPTLIYFHTALLTAFDSCAGITSRLETVLCVLFLLFTTRVLVFRSLVGGLLASEMSHIIYNYYYYCIVF